MLLFAENADEFPFEEYDYIVDAVDTVTAKIALVMKAQEKNVPIISSMGAEISWMQVHLRWLIYIRPACVLLQRSCAVSLKNVA